jgi:hypothetical protein
VGNRWPQVLKWPQVFNLRNTTPGVVLVQVENLHPRGQQVAAGFEVAAGFQPAEYDAGGGACAG